MRPDFLGPIDPDAFVRQSLRRGEEAAPAGLATDRMLIVLDGTLRDRRRNRRLLPGQIVDPLAFFGAPAYGGGIRAETDATLVHLPRDLVRRRIEAIDPLTWSLARVLAQEVAG
jgi:CRP-like cAMP-binding protein